MRPFFLRDSAVEASAPRSCVREPLDVREALSLPAVSQTLSMSNGSLSNPSKRRVDSASTAESLKKQRRVVAASASEWIRDRMSAPPFDKLSAPTFSISGFLSRAGFLACFFDNRECVGPCFGVPTPSNLSIP